MKIFSSTPYSDLSGSSKLLLDYTSNPSNLSKFFPRISLNECSIDNLVSFKHEKIQKEYDRATLVKVLLEQNNKWNSNPKIQEHIKQLLDPTSVVVIGGQQPGLFGGALLNIYKAFTLIRLAEDLLKVGVKAIPIFWIASEDHDFEEVRSSTFLTSDSYEEIKYQENILKHPSLAALSLKDEIELTFDSLRNILPKTEFTEEILNSLNNSYFPRNNWCDAFASWMSSLLSDFGLVFVNPMDVRLRNLARPVFESAIFESKKLSEKIVTRSQDLVESGYHAQVHTDSNQTLLFIEFEGQRTALLQQEDNFILKSQLPNASAVSYTAKELYEIFESNPLRITPNALLRPAIQDVIFPTIAQVVGSAELAYLAQSQPIYDHLKINPPVRWLRSSATLVEERFAKTLEKFNFSATDIFQRETNLIHQALAKSSESSAIKLFEETENVFEEQLDKIEKMLRAADPTLANALTGGREKIFYQLNNLKTKFLNNRAQSTDVVKRQIERLVISLYPKYTLQERNINIISFLNRYGITLLNQIYEKLSLDPFYHQWISLSSN